MLTIESSVPGFVRAFTQNREIDGWEEVATSWLTLAVVLSVIAVVVALIAKAFAERQAAAAGLGRGAYAGPRRSLSVLVAFFLVVTVAVALAWGLDRSYRDVVGVGGLAKSVLAAWLVYLVGFVLGLAAFYREHMPWK